MELLHWERRPHLREPVLLAAFEGWNDAGNAASGAISHFAGSWGASNFAAFEAEELFDFTASRPSIRLELGLARRLEWPRIALSSAQPAGGRDVVLVCGPEPQLRWKSFAKEFSDASRALGVSLVVLLGALLADVPHTRPVRISGGSASADLTALAGLEPSYYEGPTGILGVIADAVGNAGIPTASLWASVPHYVSQSSSPKATLALVERTARLLGTTVDVVDLEVASAAYERQVNELVASDEDALAYVRRLEEEDAETGPNRNPADEGPRLRPASGEHLAAEVERYLREHPRD
jgi:hypothetical protein